MFRKRYKEYLTDKIATKIANRLSALVYEVKKRKKDVDKFMKKEKSGIY